MHWSRKCRCSGNPRAEGPEVGPWCGNAATEEDGLCLTCREMCGRFGGAYVLSMDEVKARDGVSVPRRRAANE